MPLTRSLAGQRQGLQCLGDFVGDIRHQQEQGADAFQRGPEGIGIGQVTGDGGDAFREVRVPGRAGQGAHRNVGAAKMMKDLGADGAGGSGNKNAHGKLLVV